MQRTRLLFFVVAFSLSVLLAQSLSGRVPAAASVQKPGVSAWRIVPGKRIGKVTLGMSRSQVHRALGSPAKHLRLTDGRLVERWASRRPSTKAIQTYFLADFVTVYYRHQRVVQVDVSSPAFKLANGLSTHHSANDFVGHYDPEKSWQRQVTMRHQDDGGTPAGKHFLSYTDDTEQGLAWRYGWWGNLAPDGDPNVPLETISVHRPGQQVLLDPDGTDAFTLTSAYVEKYGYPRPASFQKSR